MKNARENILKKIRKSLMKPTALPFPESEKSVSIFQPLKQEIEIEFAEQFSKLQGRFVYCLSENELSQQIGHLIHQQGWEKIYCLEEPFKKILQQPLQGKLDNTDLPGTDVSITGCECLVARTGGIVMSAAQASGRTTSVYAPIHICIAYTSQLVYDVKDALVLVKNKYGNKMPSLITFATGPSRTADIEKTLVVGVHGPKEVYVFLVEG